MSVGKCLFVITVVDMSVFRDVFVLLLHTFGLVCYSCVINHLLLCLSCVPHSLFPLLMYLVAFLALGVFSCTARLRGRAYNLYCSLLFFFFLLLRCARSGIYLTMTERKHIRMKLVLNWTWAWSKPVFSGRTYQSRGRKLQLPVLNGTCLQLKNCSSFAVEL
jgi:hypothetical protein